MFSKETIEIIAQWTWVHMVWHEHLLEFYLLQLFFVISQLIFLELFN